MPLSSDLCPLHLQPGCSWEVFLLPAFSSFDSYVWDHTMRRWSNAILVDRLAHISQATIYFCFLIIYLNRGKQDCPGARKAEAHYLEPLLLSCFTDLIALTSLCWPLLQRSLCCFSSWITEQFTATDDWPCSDGNRKGLLSSTEPQECTVIKCFFFIIIIFTEKMQVTSPIL